MNSRFDCFDNDDHDGFVDNNFDARDGATGAPIIIAAADAAGGGAHRLIRVSAEGVLDFDVAAGTNFTHYAATPLGFLGSISSGTGTIDLDLELFSYVDGSTLEANTLSLASEEAIDRYSFCGNATRFFGVNRRNTVIRLLPDLTLDTSATVARWPPFGFYGRYCFLNGDGTIRTIGSGETLFNLDPSTLANVGSTTFFEEVGTSTSMESAGCTDGTSHWALAAIPSIGTRMICSAGDRFLGLNYRNLCMGTLDEAWVAGGSLFAYEFGNTAMLTADLSWTILAANIADALTGWTPAARFIRRYPDGDLIVVGNYTKTGSNPKLWVAKGSLTRPVSGTTGTFTKKWQVTVDDRHVGAASNGDIQYDAMVVAAGEGIDDHGYVNTSGAWDDVEY